MELDEISRKHALGSKEGAGKRTQGTEGGKGKILNRTSFLYIYTELFCIYMNKVLYICYIEKSEIVFLHFLARFSMLLCLYVL